jgi:ribosomal protein S12 methylthiotransferase
VRFYLESLGCPKNLVDAQGMVRLLEGMGHEIVDGARQAQVLVVNTCGFIRDAREESLGELRRLAHKKRPGQVLIAAGCLSQLWGERLVDQVPGVDAVLGTRRWGEIDRIVAELENGRGSPTKQPPGRVAMLGDPLPMGDDNPTRGRSFARQGATAYLKIGEGCSAPCGFCAIPRIKGPAVSRPVEAVTADAVELVLQGVQEIILIAQDTTAYGRDWGNRDGLSGLVEAILTAVPDLRWLRLMYAYPGHISRRLITVMAGDPRICHYLDLPLQHAHPDVLRRMKRPADVARTRRLIANLRAALPDMALRTSLIVGYPGETEVEFQTLLDFVGETRFDRVGTFVYSPEEGTPAAALPNPVPEPVKAERRAQLMALQQGISLESNRAQVGRTLAVLVEGHGDGLSVGRSYRDAPEIDGLVLLQGQVPIGQMVAARITSSMEYDLVGEIQS